MVQPLTDRGSSWIALFKRRGKTGVATGLFDELVGSFKADMLRLAKIKSDEVPILISSRTGKTGFILTDLNLILFHREGAIESFPIFEIEHCDADLSMIKEQRTKNSLDEIWVHLKQRGKVALGVEPGAPLIGVWSVLLNIARGNRSTSV